MPTLRGLILAYEASLWLTVLLSAVYSVILWRRRTAPGAVPLLILTLATTWWALCYVVPLPAILTADASGGLFFRFKMIYFAVVVVSPAFLMIAMQYTGQSLKRVWWLFLLLAIEPMLIIYVVWNDALSPYFFGMEWEARPQDGDFRGGVLFWLHTAYSYSIIAASLTVLAQHYHRSSTISRQQLRLIMLSIIAPLIGNVVAVSRLTPFVLDVTPVGFFVGSILIGAALFSRNLFDVVPVARDTVLECMNDGIIVLDRMGHVVDINPAACRILCLDCSAPPLGKPIAQVASPPGGWPHALLGQGELRQELSLNDGKVIELRVLPLADRENVASGRLLVMHDITALKEASRALQLTNERLLLKVSEIEAMQSMLREQAARDPLTGLYNRRFMEEMLQREINQSERNGNLLCVVMLDIDHFKSINDTYGHAAGDAILKALADLLRENSRKGDAPCRYGGEEFIVILSAAGPVEVCERVNHWREAFAARGFLFDTGKTHVTFSAGIASYPGDGRDVESLLKAADEALYLAKNLGRNRVVSADARAVRNAAG